MIYDCDPSRLFVTSFILASKLIFDNLLNSGVEIKLAVSGVWFSIFGAFVFKVALVAKLVMSDLLISISEAFVFKVAYASRLVILGILFSISVN